MLGEECVGEVGWVEGAQVLERLACSDQLHRDFQLVGYGEDDAALGGAVQLGEDDAVNLGCLGEGLCLAQAVLAGGGVDREQGLVGGAGELLAIT